MTSMAAVPSEPEGADLLVFSPHLDDAAFSCGGRIAAASRSGSRVIVVTPFSGNPAAEGKRAGGALAAFASMSARREEDRRAMDRLGAGPFWLDNEEAPGRHRAYRSFLGMFGRVRRGDGGLLQDLEETFLRLCRASPAAQLVFPLGVGGHVDHRILFEVSLRMMAAGIPSERVSFFEEIPYAMVPSMVEHRLAQIGARVADSAVPPDLAPGEPVLRTARRAMEGILAVPVVRDAIRPYQRPILHLLVWFRITSQRRRSRDRGRPALLELQPDSLDITENAPAKGQAIACYGSQLPELFGDATAWRRAALSYSTVLGAGPGRLVERYWRPVRQTPRAR